MLIDTDSIYRANFKKNDFAKTSLFVISLLILFFCCPSFGFCASAEFLKDIEEALSRGNYEGAIILDREGGAFFLKDAKAGEAVRYYIALSEVAINKGRYSLAESYLNKAFEITNKIDDRALKALLLLKRGNLYLYRDDTERALSSFESGLETAAQVPDKRLYISLLNDKAGVLYLKDDAKASYEVYQRALALVDPLNEPLLKAKILGGIAWVLNILSKDEEAVQCLLRLFEVLKYAEDSHEKARILVNTGIRIYKHYYNNITIGQNLLKRALEGLKESSIIATNLGDHRLASYAFGYQGLIEGTLGLSTHAKENLRKAYFLAQESNTPESLYQWQWRLGMVFKGEGRFDEAINLFRKSVSTLQSIRKELAGNCRLYNATSYNDSVAPVYLSLVDLLISKSKEAEGKESEKLLLEAILTLEMLRTVELQDYFRDACLESQTSTLTFDDLRLKDTSILYFITLPDRMEIIISSAKVLKSHRIDTNKTDIFRETEEFRRSLEKRTNHQYLTHAQRLYSLLIKPLENDLRETNTLVIVPEGLLRTIPFAALHRGDKFLIELHPVVVVPALTLTSLKDIRTKDNRILLSGISETVQGFPPLPYVEQEILDITKAYRHKSLVNSSFTLANLSSELSENPYNYLHIASHGEFYQDSRETFILAWDRKLTMDDLESLIKVASHKGKPITLLTLSACQSAADSDKAALGLGGIAVKSGAHTALASLWYINDQSTSTLIANFYRELQGGNKTKAEALRAAQRSLLKDFRYRHPGYWSPFLMIGNWR